MKIIEQFREWVQQLTSPAGTLAAHHRHITSAGATDRLRNSASSLQVVWWRWRHHFLEAKQLDLALRRDREAP
jgi:hypothetical protein